MGPVSHSSHVMKRVDMDSPYWRYRAYGLLASTMPRIDVELAGNELAGETQCTDDWQHRGGGGEQYDDDVARVPLDQHQQDGENRHARRDIEVEP